MKQESIEELKQRGDANRAKAEKSIYKKLEHAGRLAAMQNESEQAEGGQAVAELNTKEVAARAPEREAKPTATIDKFREKFARDRQNERGGRER